MLLTLIHLLIVSVMASAQPVDCITDEETLQDQLQLYCDEEIIWEVVRLETHNYIMYSCYDFEEGLIATGDVLCE